MLVELQLNSTAKYLFLVKVVASTVDSSATRTIVCGYCDPHSSEGTFDARRRAHSFWRFIVN